MKKMITVCLAASVIMGTIIPGACSTENKDQSSSSSGQSAVSKDVSSNTDKEESTDSSASQGSVDNSSSEQSIKEDSKAEDNKDDISEKINMNVEGRKETVDSVKNVLDDFYQISYKEDYHLDSVLAADISDEKKLIEYFTVEMFNGNAIITPNLDKYACSAFTAETPDGKRLAGRNFGLLETDELMVYTQPKDGYASYSMVDLDMIGVGGDKGLSPDSKAGKLCMLTAPYLCMDGMNEKGVMAALLQLDGGDIHQDNGKKDLLIPVAVRLILDRAANVDEALGLLGQYDIQMGLGHVYHMYICDKSGKSVVVEWKKGEMIVTESQFCTNFWFSDYKNRENYNGLCYRFDHISKTLTARPSTDENQAMQLLSEVPDNFTMDGKMFSTQWSCVYRLDDFEADVAVDQDYNTVHHFTPESFR